MQLVEIDSYLILKQFQNIQRTAQMLLQILDLPFTWFQYSIDSKPQCNSFGL